MLVAEANIKAPEKASKKKAAEDKEETAEA